MFEMYLEKFMNIKHEQWTFLHSVIIDTNSKHEQKVN